MESEQAIVNSVKCALEELVLVHRDNYRTLQSDYNELFLGCSSILSCQTAYLQQKSSPLLGKLVPNGGVVVAEWKSRECSP